MKKDPALTFDIETHTYRVGGQVVPHVTGIEQAAGLVNFDGVPQDRLDYKSALGTAVHRCIELHNSNNLDEDSIDNRIRPYFLAYKKFTEVYRYEPQHSELRLYSKKWRFAGTLDSYGIITLKEKEIPAIFDWKCSWIMYPSNGPQLAAYQILFEDNFKEKIKGRFGLQLKETGNFELIQYKDETDRQIFLSALTLYHWRLKHGLIKGGSHDEHNHNGKPADA